MLTRVSPSQLRIIFYVVHPIRPISAKIQYSNIWCTVHQTSGMEHIDHFSYDLQLVTWNIQPEIERFNEFSSDLFARVGRGIFEGFKDRLETNISAT